MFQKVNILWVEKTEFESCLIFTTDVNDVLFQQGSQSQNHLIVDRIIFLLCNATDV